MTSGMTTIVVIMYGAVYICHGAIRKARSPFALREGMRIDPASIHGNGDERLDIALRNHVCG